MNFLLTQTAAWLLFAGLTLGLIIAIGIILYLFFGLRKKRENVKPIIVDSEFIDKVLQALGGKDNIKSLTNDNGRVKFIVQNLDLLDTDTLKELSPNGVFITGSNVKLLFKYEAKEVIASLAERGVSCD